MIKGEGQGEVEIELPDRYKFDNRDRLRHARGAGGCRGGAGVTELEELSPRSLAFSVEEVPEMPKIPDEILDLEKRFWTEGPDFYLQNLDEKCLTVFADAAGLWTAEEIAKTVKSSGRWKDVQIDPKGGPPPDAGHCAAEL